MSDPNDYTVLVVLAVTALLIYLGDCWRYPRKPCRKCKGTGRFWSPLTNSWRECPRGPFRVRVVARWMGRG